MTSVFWSRDRHSGNDFLSELRVENLHVRAFCRMFYSDFDALINLLGPRISKEDTTFRKAIPVAEQLAVTLRFLECGDSFTSPSSLFKMSKHYVPTIIHFLFHFCHTDAKFFRNFLPRVIFMHKFITLMGCVPQNHVLFVLTNWLKCHIICPFPVHGASTVSSELHVSPSFKGLRASLWWTDNSPSHTSPSTYERATTPSPSTSTSTSSLDPA
jgi:hypothetical protein